MLRELLGHLRVLRLRVLTKGWGRTDMFVGYRTIELVDEFSGAPFPMAVMYPTLVPGKKEKLGPYSLDLSINAVPQEGKFPLTLISHGSGGSYLLYRMLAHHLASNGFIVGMPEHPFNNLNNNILGGTFENLTNRPRHIQTAINWFFKQEFARLSKDNAVSVIGHSLGGYTALALAGGVPTFFPNESSNRQPQRISATPDLRIKALVLLAPAAVWFKANRALDRVNIPILMFVGEKDKHTPRYHAQIILDGVPDKKKIQYRIVENAGHFSFLSPYPQSMTKTSFPPSQDPPGFDRESFHAELNAEVLDFLLRHT